MPVSQATGEGQVPLSCATSARSGPRRRPPLLPLLADCREFLLAGCRGFPHADGYAGFADLYEPEPTTGVPCLTEVACWAHARRKIYAVHAETGSPASRETLKRIARLFAVEADIRSCGPADRRDARRRRSASILAELKTFLNATLATISGKSSLAGAIRYATSRWAARGKIIATKPAPKLIGNSLQTTHSQNSSVYIQRFS